MLATSFMTRSNPTSLCFCAPDSRERCAVRKKISVFRLRMLFAIEFVFKVKEIGREYPAAEETVQRSITWHPVSEDVIIKANGS